MVPVSFSLSLSPSSHSLSFLPPYPSFSFSLLSYLANTTYNRHLQHTSIAYSPAMCTNPACVQEETLTHPRAQHRVLMQQHRPVGTRGVHMAHTRRRQVRERIPGHAKLSRAKQSGDIPEVSHVFARQNKLHLWGKMTIEGNKREAIHR